MRWARRPSVANSQGDCGQSTWVTLSSILSRNPLLLLPSPWVLSLLSAPHPSPLPYTPDCTGGGRADKAQLPGSPLPPHHILRGNSSTPVSWRPFPGGTGKAWGEATPAAGRQCWSSGPTDLKNKNTTPEKQAQRAGAVATQKLPTIAFEGLAPSPPTSY